MFAQIPATTADVIEIYQTFLNRPPESKAAFDVHVGKPIGALIAAFLNSAEYKSRVFTALEHERFFNYPANQIETSGSPTELTAVIERVKKVWSRYGETDPLWSVLTNETFRKSKLNPTANAAFFESGKADAQAFFNTCARNGIQPPKSGTVLDFGCGVGRVGYFLAHHFSGYVGVDISQPHLELAKQRLANQARKSQFFNLPDFLSSKMRYDAIYSVIVLQHNPPPIIMWLLERLLSSLTRKGVAYFQVPCSLIGYKFSLAEYLAATPSDAMEMHAIPQSAVFGIAERTNCRVLEVMPDGKASHIGTSFSFLLQKM